MKFAAFLPISLLLITTSALASPERCEFDKVEGLLFEFSHPQPIIIRSDVVDISDKKNYPHWFKSANTKEPIKKDEYFGRLAKVKDSRPVKRVSENTFKDVREELSVRYYSAIADNCEQIYLRIIENDFPQYFSKDLFIASRKFDFLEQERWGGYTLLENLKDLESGKVKLVTVRPSGDKKIYFVDTIGSKSINLPRYTTLNVLDVRRTPFYLHNDMLSNYTIEVNYQGERGFINADYRYLFNGNPLLSLPSENIDAVAKGKVRFGMTSSEVMLSLGMPIESKIFAVYKTYEGYRTDYDGELGKKDFKLAGYISHWSYADIKEPLIFNINDTLEEGKQRFSRFDAMGLPNYVME